MKYYAVQITDDYRPHFYIFQCENLDEALILTLKTLHPEKTFDGLNHLTDFIETVYSSLYKKDNCYVIYHKYTEIIISDDLETVLKKLSQQV
jgi:hypothetical protein